MTQAEPTAPQVPTSDELVALSQQHQLALPMFVMTSLLTDAGMAAVLAAIPAHAEYWAKLEESGVLFAGGPLLPEHGSDPWAGDALIIIKAQSLAAADAIAQADPMHTSGARQYELRAWLLNHLVVPDKARP